MNVNYLDAAYLKMSRFGERLVNDPNGPVTQRITSLMWKTFEYAVQCGDELDSRHISWDRSASLFAQAAGSYLLGAYVLFPCTRIALAVEPVFLALAALYSFDVETACVHVVRAGTSTLLNMCMLEVFNAALQDQLLRMKARHMLPTDTIILPLFGSFSWFLSKI